MAYLLHIVAGTLALLSGYVALYAVKGERVHRRAGMVFVYSMLAMCAGGLLLAIARGAAPYLNVPAALLTAYLVITALTTVRPLAAHARWLDAGGLAVALGVGLAALAFGAEAAVRAPPASAGTGCRPFRSSCSAWWVCWARRATSG